MASPVDVVQILRNARDDAQRNAAVLDNISTPKQTDSQREALPSQTPLDTKPTEKLNSGANANPPLQNSKHSDPQDEEATNEQHTGTTAPNKEKQPPGGSDTLLASGTAESSSKSDTPHPISKYILSSLFEAVDRLARTPKAEKSPNYMFIESEKENNFLYGLVLPLIARLLAVSCPGVVCVVQLPRQSRRRELSSPPYASYGSNGSNGSNGSKSLGHTTPSPQDTSRTPSPSDEDLGGGTRNSISPDSNPGTAELIRHADKILSGAEAAAEKRAAEARGSEESSPPPEVSVHDHGTLRLICNGFEVLTGKMPSPKSSMGTFTMASVGWEKAGVVSPSTPNKGVTMSFSNGMMVLTEGLVVTFSNGSMCLLTLEDPLSAAEALRISDATPVVIFSFSDPGDVSRGSLLRQQSTEPHPEIERTRAMVSKPNIFVVEVGDAQSNSSNDMSTSAELLERMQPKITKTNSLRSAERSNLKKSTLNSSSDLCAPRRCPPMPIAAVPRAIPLFVNTINQTFIDGPYYEVPENSYGNVLCDDRFRDITHRSHMRRSHRARANSRENKRGRHPNGKLLPPTPVERKEKNGVVNTAAPCNSMSVGVQVEKQPQEDVPKESQPASRPNGRTESTQAPFSTSLPVNHTPSGGGPPVGVKGDSAAFYGGPQYEYYPYGPGTSLPNGYSQGHSGHNAQSLLRHRPVSHHGSLASMSGTDPRYFHNQAPPLNGPISHGHYHHQPYYSAPPQGMIHSIPQGGGPWQDRAPSLPHRPVPLASPHPMDARRDMPVHFASHRAVASAHGHFNTQQFRGPPHPQPSYDGRHNRVTPRSSIPGYHYRKTDSNLSPVSSGLIGPPARNANPTRELYYRRVDAHALAGEKEGSATKMAEPVAANGVTPRYLTSEANSVQERRCIDTPEYERQTNDKESAMRALIEMQSGVHADVSGAGKDAATRGIHSGGLRKSAPAMNNHSPNTSSEACSVDPEKKTAATASSHANDRVLIRSRSRMSTGTNSSTSTNSHSQGKVLTQGSVIGDSPHSNHPVRVSSERSNKRQRRS